MNKHSSLHSRKPSVMRLSAVVLAVLYLVLFCNNSLAYALTKDQKQVFDRGILFYNTEVCGDSSTILTGNDNLQKIFNYFVGNGFTPEQAAGIVGNIMIESGGDPQIYEGGKIYAYPPSTTDMRGWGIVQWTPPSKITTYAEKVGEQPNLLETQVEFLLKQLNGTAPVSNEKAAGDQLKAVTSGITVDGEEKSTAWHAAQVFLMTYERAADHEPNGPNAQKRGKLADQALALYGSSAQVSGNSADGSSAVSSSCGISAHCDSPLTTGDYDAIKTTLMDKFKIDLRGDRNVPWAIETYNTICTLAKSQAFYSKLTNQGPIVVTLHTLDFCGYGHTGHNGDDPYGLSMSGYCANSKDYNRYLLVHELGHMYDFRNSDIKQAFNSQIWGHAPTLPTFNCQHDYDHLGKKGPYQDECFADMIGEYVIYFDLRATAKDKKTGIQVPVGTHDFKQYPTEYSAYYNFARDNIFGGITYTSF